MSPMANIIISAVIGKNVQSAKNSWFLAIATWQAKNIPLKVEIMKKGENIMPEKTVEFQIMGPNGGWSTRWSEDCEDTSPISLPSKGGRLFLC